MLRDLRIQNYAIIDDLSLSFGGGLNIITGDTGAGKSILVGALGLVLGGRASPDMVRTGADQARVTACLDLSQAPDQAQRLRELGVQVENGEVVIQRSFQRTGKTRITVNGDPATVGLLSRIGEGLVDIHGQHEHHSLMNRDHHVDLLDAFGKTGALLKSYQEQYREVLRVKQELARIESVTSDRERRLDFLRFQIREIDEFDPKPGEEGLLNDERSVLRNAERIAMLAHEAYAMLYESEDSVSDRLGQILSRIEELSRLDTRIRGLAAQGAEMKSLAQDMAHTLRDCASGIEPDPERLNVIEDRLEKLSRLKRKYGQGIQEILQSREEAREELARLDGSEESASQLRSILAAALSGAGRLADEISQARTKAAREMERALEKELATLRMSGTSFKVQMETRPAEPNEPPDSRGRALAAKGIDFVEFLVSPNVGEEPRPLIRIASGGELSRIMLAIKAVLAHADHVAVLIFDEIDAGIGGGVAEVLGRRLRHVARNRQVVCVTHLPQVASQGQTHHHIGKEVQKGRTRVTARMLGDKERVQEIARMLGGIEITRTTVQHAREMLRLSNGL